MPFSLTWYNHSKKGSFYQPFNQFGISPTYKWLKVHLGYRNLTFSEFTLSGYTFLGAGVEATPGKFRFGAVYGKFNQNSTYDLAMADSIENDADGMGGKSRVRNREPLRRPFGAEDRGQYQAVRSAIHQPGMPTPEQNVAFGLTSRFEITPKLLFSFDGSYSFYTKDLTLAPADSIADAMLRFAGNLITVNNSANTSRLSRPASVISSLRVLSPWSNTDA